MQKITFEHLSKQQPLIATLIFFIVANHEFIVDITGIVVGYLLGQQLLISSGSDPIIAK